MVLPTRVTKPAARDLQNRRGIRGAPVGPTRCIPVAHGRFNEHGEWSPKEYRLVTQRPQFVYLRLLASTLGGGNLGVEHLATEEDQ
jgi:hypothetical protein